MNKKEIIKVVANNVEGATQKDIGVVFDTVIETIKKTVIGSYILIIT